MNIGVIIEKGVVDWEVIQQKNGYGVVTLAGRYYENTQLSAFTVLARVVREANSEPVTEWLPAKTDIDGTWFINIKDIPAGGLYRIETFLRNDSTGDRQRGDFRHHVGIGDLYIIAGQSNASGSARDFIMDEPEVGVHVLRTNGRWDMATHPLNDATGTIHEANRDEWPAGHSPFISFGKYLKRELAYPIGLIPTALGGSPLSDWMPDGILYQNMMEILSGVQNNVCGILWYQGCTDAEIDTLYGDYEERFTVFVQAVRKKLGDDLPFYTVQLNRRTDEVSDIGDHGFTVIREAQRQLSKKLKKVYLVPAIDGSLSDLIHNNASFNLVLGERIAKQVLAKNHGKRFLCDAPDYQSGYLEGNIVTLKFTNVTDMLDAFEVSVDDLSIQVMDDQGVIPLQSYEIVKDQIRLELKRVAEGDCYVSNACGSNPKGRLLIDFGTHYPVLSFYKESVQRR